MTHLEKSRFTEEVLLYHLLVPVCMSASHIAYGSICTEPVFMIRGQSAATAAVIAVLEELAVQDVPYERLRGLLLADDQVLESARVAEISP